MLLAPPRPRCPAVGLLESGGRKDAAQATCPDQKSALPGRALRDDAAGRPVRAAFVASLKAVSEIVGAEGALVGDPVDDDGPEKEEKEEEEGQTATTGENGGFFASPLLVVEDWSGRPERPLLEAIVGPPEFFAPPAAAEGAGGGPEISRRPPRPNPVIVVDDWSSKAPARPAGDSPCLAGLDAEAGGVPEEGGEQQQQQQQDRRRLPRRRRLRRARPVPGRLCEEQHHPFCPPLLSPKSPPVRGSQQIPVYCALR